jgi:FdhE protein
VNRAAPLDLREEWLDLLERRPTLAPSLELYGEIFDCWAAHAVQVEPLALPDEVAVACRERGEPLVTAAAPAFVAVEVEEILGPVMEVLARRRPDLAPALERFAGAWDVGVITPGHLLPARGRIGSVPEDVLFDPPLLAFLSTAALRPFLAACFAGRREQGSARSPWALGICPDCGGPPSFADVIEDGTRRLACHLCGGGWSFPRLRCPLCGEDESKHHVRLQAEAADEGYAVSACARCGGYLKELDRRVRWNGRSALVEDWGSPHLDFAARRAGYWRPLPSLLDLARGRAPESGPSPKGTSGL